MKMVCGVCKSEMLLTQGKGNTVVGWCASGKHKAPVVVGVDIWCDGVSFKKGAKVKVKK